MFVLYPINEYSVELPIAFISYIDAVTYGVKAYGETNFVVQKKEKEYGE